MPIQSANVPLIITLDQWMGVNLQSSRTSVNDQESYWLENMFPVGPGQLRSAYGPSAPLYTAPAGTTILRMFFANISTRDRSGFMFLSNGHVVRVGFDTGTTVDLGAIWQPDPPWNHAAFKVWIPTQMGAVEGEVGGALIGSSLGLYAVDANDVVTGPGQAPPLWLTNNQTLDVNGNPLVMPSGLPGIWAMEVYGQRLWVSGQSVISFSAPSNGADFSAAGGGGSFPFFGDQLTYSYTDLAASAGFLYVFSDSSTWTISKVQLVGSPTPIGQLYTAQFQFQNIDPQIGQGYFRPVGFWEQALTVCNEAGIYMLGSGQYGWISERITNPLISRDDPQQFAMTQCPVHVFNKKWMLFLGRMNDIDGVRRSMLFAWSGPQLKQWVVASQHVELTEIASMESNSIITAYGTDGVSLYQLFAEPDGLLPKRIQTKAYTGQFFLTEKDWKRTYIEWQDNQKTPWVPWNQPPIGPEGSHITGELVTSGGAGRGGRLPVSYSLPPGGSDTIPSPEPGKGFWAALDLHSLSPDFTVARISFTYEDRSLYGA